MPRFLGRSNLPRPVREAVDKGERVLAHAELADGTYVIATERRLLLPHRGALRSMPWERISHAAWSDGVLEVEVTGGADGPGERYRLYVPEDAALHDFIRDRVTASVVISERVALRGTRGARIAARRAPGSSDISWTVAFDPGLDPSDPALRALADAEVERLRRLVE